MMIWHRLGHLRFAWFLVGISCDPLAHVAQPYPGPRDPGQSTDLLMHLRLP